MGASESVGNDTQGPTVFQFGAPCALKHRLRGVPEVYTQLAPTGDGHDVERDLALMQAVGLDVEVVFLDAEAVLQVGIVVPVHHTGNRQKHFLAHSLVEHQRELHRAHHQVGMAILELILIAHVTNTYLARLVDSPQIGVLGAIERPVEPHTQRQTRAVLVELIAQCHKVEDSGS